MKMFNKIWDEPPSGLDLVMISILIIIGIFEVINYV